MNFFVRFFVGYVVLAAIGVFLAWRIFTEQLVPGVRQSVEDTLVQTAHMLAEFVAADGTPEGVDASHIDAVFKRYGERRFTARIYGVIKDEPDLRVYVTDRHGKVIYDSRNQDTGKDYSRWRDVLLTLQGHYGARTTRDDPADESSTVMYVAAPIRRDNHIIGVLSVGKPNRSFQTYIDMGRTKAGQVAIVLFLASLVIALGFSYWMTRDLRRLATYANEVAAGRRGRVPQIGRSELRRLAQALEHMRAELDGKTHVERVAQLLAHELKSPITAVQGAAELLEDETDATQRARLTTNIRAESSRLQRIVEGMLNLAVAENRDQLQNEEDILLAPLIEEVLASRESRLAAKSLRVEVKISTVLTVRGERFLLRQALCNLLDNAIDFSHARGDIEFCATSQADTIHLSVRDHGSGIPSYAQQRLFERFYSVPRPDSGERGTGLGLNFTQQVALLHGGSLHVDNHPQGGVEAIFKLPAAS